MLFYSPQMELNISMQFCYIRNCNSSNTIIFNNILYKPPRFMRIWYTCLSNNDFVNSFCFHKERVISRLYCQCVLLEFLPCSFLLKRFKNKKVFAILLIVMVDWIVWVISSQIGNKATISLSFLTLWFDFIVEGASSFLRYSYVKFL